MAASTKVFESIGQTFDNAVQTFVADVATSTIATVYPWALGFLSLYVMLYGYMIAFGKIDEPFKEGIIKCVKIMFIGTMALNADMYLNGVVSAFQGIEEGLTSAFSGGNGGSIYASLDSSLSKGLELILQCRQKAQEAGWTEFGTSLGWWLIALIIAIGFALVVVFGGVLIMVSSVYMKILFAIGPVFIMAAMFPVSVKFFDAWAGYVLNHTLIIALCAVVLTFGVSVYDHEITKVTIDSDQNMLLVSLELLVIAAIIYAVMKGVPSMAAALAGGITMAVMGVTGIGRSAGNAARNTANVAAGTAKGAMAVGKGGYGAAKWAANKLRRNNTVSETPTGGNSGVGNYTPAYRREVLDRLQRAQQ